MFGGPVDSQSETVILQESNPSPAQITHQLQNEPTEKVPGDTVKGPHDTVAGKGNVAETTGVTAKPNLFDTYALNQQGVDVLDIDTPVGSNDPVHGLKRPLQVQPENSHPPPKKINTRPGTTNEKPVAVANSNAKPKAVPKKENKSKETSKKTHRKRNRSSRRKNCKA